MPDKSVVKQFLDDFKTKLSIWGVFFRDDRGKNIQALLDLEMTPIGREEVIRCLEVDDYSQGPKENTLFGGAPLWVFGVELKRKEKGTKVAQEIYIKISMGASGTKTICISFHPAERKMNYPFKQ